MRGGTWIVLASKRAVPIHVTLHDLSKSNRPVEVYLVVDHPPEVLLSAQRGCQAAWAAAQAAECGFPRCSVGFDIRGVTPKEPISGQSGGLAFGLAMVQRRLGLNDPVAATGVVAAGTPPGPLEPVEGFREKCEAVEELARGMAGGLRFFFPRGNLGDLGVELQTRLEAAGVEPIPVESVEEAVRLLLRPRGQGRASPGVGSSGGRRGPSVPVLWLAGLLAAAGLAGGAAWWSGLLPHRLHPGPSPVSANGSHAGGGRGPAAPPAPGSSAANATGNATTASRGKGGPSAPSLSFEGEVAAALRKLFRARGLAVDPKALEGGLNCTRPWGGGGGRCSLTIPAPGKGAAGGPISVTVVEPPGRRVAPGQVAGELMEAVSQELEARRGGWKERFSRPGRRGGGAGRHGELKPGSRARLPKGGKEGGGDAGFE